MNTPAENEIPKIKHFRITVDGKTYGPFPLSKERRFKSLRHAAGVKFEYVWLDGMPKAQGPRPKAQGPRRGCFTFSFRRFGLAAGATA
ncbi:hypothetical protein F6V25_07875 [Oryzomonas japonica]|uniref:Uncharacterized protein n=1 Tax=Oryzomonas japonica TaxID=2603858 RepID=A0A7J4ZR46_9BACT|nr:hypothetical protein [Oryzomonas japonica]KAB0665631.1 hypothetical protein F6V25_07875 [Oryzomonas japonica]